MNWKVVLGGALLVYGGARVVVSLLHFDGSSYGLGQLIGSILLGLFGVWLIRSGRQQVKS